jgi:hypothetical protein
MARLEGTPKTGGRKKGTKNKDTETVRSLIEEIGFNVPRRLIELLPSLEPSKQADVLLKLMSFLYPSLKAVEQTVVRERKGSSQYCGKWIEDMTDDELTAALNELKELKT